MLATFNNTVYQSAFSILICIIKQGIIGWNLGVHLLDFKLLDCKWWMLMPSWFFFFRLFFFFPLKRNVFNQSLIHENFKHS